MNAVNKGTPRVARTGEAKVAGGAAPLREVVLVQARVLHAQRIENALLEKCVEGHAADAFQNQAEQVVAAVAVLPFCARLISEGWLAELFGKFLMLVAAGGFACGVKFRRIEVGRKAGSVVKQTLP